MAVCSMTGYASRSGICHGTTWLWQLRSVNGKGLDIRMRMAADFEEFEQKLRRECARVLTRGHLQASLTIKDQQTSSELVLNQRAFESVLEIIKDLGEKSDIKKPTMDGLLNICGILQERQPERSIDEKYQLENAVNKGFMDVLIKLDKARQEEGAVLANIVRGQLKEITSLVDKIITDPSRTQQAIKERLKIQIRNLMDADTNFDESRLYLEAAILATKFDLQEEIDRLLVHIDAISTLLDKGGPIGRRLDFLAQELNRECNTICSKSNAVNITTIGLELKVLVDQFREQIQNLE